MNLLLVVFACAPAAPEEPPPDMEELTWMLLRDFGTPAAEEEVELLAGWVAAEIDAGETGYVLEAPPADHVAELEVSENLDLERMAGALVMRRVRGGIDAYAATVPLPDQRFADDSYIRWDRALDNGDEASWAERGPLTAHDAVEKSAGFGIVLPYPMLREYAWVQASPGARVLNRAVIYDEGWADDNNGVLGGYTVELWLPDGDDGMIWLNATWTQVVTVLGEAATEAFFVQQIIDGSTEAMVGTEAYVNGEAE